eukprot:COSAG05_NODE_1809_length_4041_cov_4.735921_7_plen_27_part_01
MRHHDLKSKEDGLWGKAGGFSGEPARG